MSRPVIGRCQVFMLSVDKLALHQHKYVTADTLCNYFCGHYLELRERNCTSCKKTNLMSCYISAIMQIAKNGFKGHQTKKDRH
jgi:hypothetical protein